MFQHLTTLSNEQENKIILSKIKALNNKEGKDIVKSMVATADLSRSGFINGDISTVMSPRTVLTWAENYLLLDDIEHAFKLSFLIDAMKWKGLLLKNIFKDLLELISQMQR